MHLSHMLPQMILPSKSIHTRPITTTNTTGMARCTGMNNLMTGEVRLARVGLGTAPSTAAESVGCPDFVSSVSFSVEIRTH